MITVAHDSQFARTLLDLGGVEGRNSNGVEVVVAGVGRTLDTWRIHDNERGVSFLCAAMLAADNETIVALAYHVIHKSRSSGSAVRLSTLADARVDAPKDLRQAAMRLAIGGGVLSLWKDETLPRVAQRIFRKGDRVLQPGDATYALPKTETPTTYTAHGLYYKKGVRPIEWVLVRQMMEGKQIQLWKVKPTDVYNATLTADLQQVMDGVENLYYARGLSYMIGRPIPLAFLLTANVLYAKPVQNKLTAKENKDNEQASESSGATADAPPGGGVVGADGSGDEEANASAPAPATLSDGNGVHL